MTCLCNTDMVVHDSSTIVEVVHLNACPIIRCSTVQTKTRKNLVYSYDKASIHLPLLIESEGSIKNAKMSAFYLIQLVSPIIICHALD